MTATKTNYLLKIHPLYAQQISLLKEQVRKLKQNLPPDDFIEHPDVKFAARLRRATVQTIPEDPDRPDYRLKRTLKKFRGYRKGLQRYRLFYCFASEPPVIAYLYVNDKASLRKEGSERNSYIIFQKLVAQKKVSADPNDPRLTQWLATQSTSLGNPARVL